MIKALKENNLYALIPLMENILETVTIKEHPIIEEIKGLMKSKGALTALMSGSGPTVYGIFDNKLKAKQAYDLFKSSDWGYQVILTEPYSPAK